MNLFKRKFNIKKVLSVLTGAIIIVGVLTVAFVYGGNYNKDTNSATVSNSAYNKTSPVKPETPTETQIDEPVNKIEEKHVNKSINDDDQANTKNSLENDSHNKDEKKTEQKNDQNVSQSKAVQSMPVQQEASDQPYCTISVSCKTILNNINLLDSDKVNIIPNDGMILKETKVEFTDGESVFDVLQREMKKANINFEFSNTPIYKSAYIEGIYNLYEFDCGELSGWVYSVNGIFPSYGCSRYILKDGDKIQWHFTCDLGTDVGGNNFAK